MLSDIEIASQAKMDKITEVAAKIGLEPDELELYGNYKAKVPLTAVAARADKPSGKLVLVTAMNPTPAGEGKTTVSIGLAQAMNLLDRKVCLALREPSLGPVFGIKGGAAGGGYSQVVPMEDINLHFTGDLHAITAANNLLAAMIDNHLYQGNELKIDKDRILWKRCLDMNDRALRNITVGVGGGTSGVTRDDIFQITAACEVMSVLCLADGLEDLKARLARIAVAYDTDGKLVTAGDLGAVGSMATLLKDAIKPNLVQSLEHVPAFIHGGPFANISHGCNTVVATKAALKFADIVITEAGFGADLGAEKFLDIKCRQAGLWPSAVVIVSTVRSLKYNAGVPKEDLNIKNTDAVRKGFANLAKHIENMNFYGIPTIVASNRFPSDTEEELQVIEDMCRELGASFAPADIYSQGGKGGIDLANKVLAELDSDKPLSPRFVYDDEDSVKEKVTKVAKTIYGAGKVDFLPHAEEKIREFTEKGYGKLPVCIAKTQYSLSDDPKSLGRPEDFTLTVRDVYLSAGAGYLVILTGTILTMPGLPKKPAALGIDIDKEGNISGLF
ncbi:MAG: formate--tetrahydrofolate ligase [Clostridiales bacterium]|nr:formate--tetrahydrofolate ligase [Clostridiales bacterium]